MASIFDTLRTTKDILGGALGFYNPERVKRRNPVVVAPRNNFTPVPPPSDNRATTSSVNQAAFSSGLPALPEVDVPPADEVVDQAAETAADLVESILADISDLSAQTAGFEIDMDALREEAVDLVTPYYEEELEFLRNDIEEGRIQTREDLDFRLSKIQQEASQQLTKFDLREAQTEEELEAKLEDIGATTDFNVDQLQRNIQERVAQEEKSLLQAGLGFSGRAKERLGDVREEGAVQLGETARRGAFRESEAERIAGNTLEELQNARLAVKEDRELLEGRVDTLRDRSVRALGAEGQFDDLGLQGGRRAQRLERGREERVQSEIQNLREQRLAEQTQALRPKKEEITNKISSLQALRGGSYL